MKKAYISFLVLVVMSVLLAGCFNFAPDNHTTIVMKTGRITFNMDFGSLSEVISQVKVICTNPMAENRVQNLVIIGKTAFGVVENLEEGMWHIRVEIYDDMMNLLYSGENDVNIMASMTATVDFTFEPSPTPDTTGDLAINVVINDFAGHTLIPQSVDQALQSPMTNAIYLMDAARKLITRYDPSGFMKMNEYYVTEIPTCMAFGIDDLKLYVGFASGHVGYVDTTTGTLNILANNLGNVEDIVVAQGHLIVRSVDATNNIFFSVSTTNGQIVNTTLIPLNGTADRMTYNVIVSKIYFTVDNPVEAVQIYALNIDAMGFFGTFKSILLDSTELGGPVRFIQGDTLLVTASGNLYQCAMDDLTDLTNMGTIGAYSYWDMVSDPMSDLMYLINRYDETAYNEADVYINKLSISNYFNWGNIALEGGHPKRIFLNGDSANVTILVENSGQWYFKKVTVN